MTDARIVELLSDDGVDASRRSAMPRAFEPMLATLVDAPFDDDAWIFERKLDGIRVLALRDTDGVRLYTRNGKRRDAHFPEIVEALAAQACRRFVLDGEVVAFDGATTSFARLQQRAGLTDRDEQRASGVAVYFYVFDCPWVDGVDLRRVALRERKRVLRACFEFDNRLRLSTYRNAAGKEFFRQACGKGWEGLVAKRADSGYRSGRSKRWLKIKCEHGQELVIAGFTDPQGGRVGFGALLLGYYENDALRYAGRVGTGFDNATLKAMRERLQARERADSPFADDDIDTAGVHWVAPELVGEIAFTEWTADGRLRHPRFLGERDDKDPRTVVRERAAN